LQDAKNNNTGDKIKTSLHNLLTEIRRPTINGRSSYQALLSLISLIEYTFKALVRVNVENKNRFFLP